MKTRSLKHDNEDEMSEHYQLDEDAQRLMRN